MKTSRNKKTRKTEAAGNLNIWETHKNLGLMFLIHVQIDTVRQHDFPTQKSEETNVYSAQHGPERVLATPKRTCLKQYPSQHQTSPREKKTNTDDKQIRKPEQEPRRQAQSFLILSFAHHLLGVGQSRVLLGGTL